MQKRSKDIKLNLGCGTQVPEGWINVDYSLGSRFAKIPFFRSINRKLKLFDLDWNQRIYLHDLTRKFPWEDGSVDVVYSSHTLEHFTREQGRLFLTECYRVLKRNGIIRIVVPDLQHIIGEYIEGRLLAEDFVEKLGVLCGNSKHSIKKRLAWFIEFSHKCMYDTKTILRILGQIGFNATSRNPFDSKIEDIKIIETEERTKNAVIVEGIR